MVARAVWEEKEVPIVALTFHFQGEGADGGMAVLLERVAVTEVMVVRQEGYM
jgi:hypothetical protein